MLIFGLHCIGVVPRPINSIDFSKSASVYTMIISTADYSNVSPEQEKKKVVRESHRRRRKKSENLRCWLHPFGTCGSIALTGLALRPRQHEQ